MLSRKLRTSMSKLQLSFLSSSAVTSGTTFTLPSTIISGDLLILSSVAANTLATFPTAVTPADFTDIFNTTGATRWRAQGYYKIADSSDASRVVNILNGTNTTNTRIAIFRTNNSKPTASVGSVNTFLGTTDAGTQTITSASSTGGTVVFAYGVNAASPNNLSLQDADGYAGGAYQIGYKLYQIYTPPQDRTVSKGTPSGGAVNGLFSFYIELKP